MCTVLLLKSGDLNTKEEKGSIKFVSALVKVCRKNGFDIKIVCETGDHSMIEQAKSYFNIGTIISLAVNKRALRMSSVMPL